MWRTALAALGCTSCVQAQADPDQSFVVLVRQHRHWQVLLDGISMLYRLRM